MDADLGDLDLDLVWQVEMTARPFRLPTHLCLARAKEYHVTGKKQRSRHYF